MTPFSITWQAPEYEHRPKEISWYWISIIIAVILLAVAIWQRNFLFAVFVVIAEILVLTWGERPPRMMEFKITEKEISINHTKSHLWSDIKNFSLHEEEDGWNEFTFYFKRRFHPILSVKAPTIETPSIHAALKTVLLEIPYDPSFLDTFEKLIRF